MTAGGSTGGWEALALQVFYPDFFGGAWGWCPDPVDFHYYQIVNIYEDENAYRKIVLDKEGCMAGAIFLGLTEGVQDCLAAIAKKAPAGRFIQDMKQKDFGFKKLL